MFCNNNIVEQTCMELLNDGITNHYIRLKKNRGCNPSYKDVKFGHVIFTKYGEMEEVDNVCL